MRITWKPCPHITYVSDDEDQAGWQYLVVECPDCGAMGTNVEDGKLDTVGQLVAETEKHGLYPHQTTDMGPGGY